MALYRGTLGTEVALGRFFSRILPRKGQAPEVEVQVAAFGKHPGWDDHIEDLGLATSRLIAVKRVLYGVGIAGNIDSGAWEKLAPAERLEGFHHFFLWRLANDLIVGRMWSSSDGKGRTRYPMVVCAQCSGLSLEWIFQHVVPHLEEVERRCVQTAAAADVRSIIAESGQTLRQLAQGAEAAREPLAPSPRALARLADRPEMRPERRGMQRILYLIEREMNAYRPDAADATTTSTAILRASHIRVPACAPTPRAAATLWMGFLLGQFDPSAPLLVFIPIGQPWLDVVVGEPGVQQFYCIRAALSAIPLATEVPYNLDADFIARVESAIEESRGGPAPPQEVEEEPAQSATVGSPTVATAGQASRGTFPAETAAAAEHPLEAPPRPEPAPVLPPEAPPQPEPAPARPAERTAPPPAPPEPAPAAPQAEAAPPPEHPQAEEPDALATTDMDMVVVPILASEPKPAPPGPGPQAPAPPSEPAPAPPPEPAPAPAPEPAPAPPPEAKPEPERAPAPEPERKPVEAAQSATVGSPTVATAGQASRVTLPEPKPEPEPTPRPKPEPRPALRQAQGGLSLPKAAPEPAAPPKPDLGPLWREEEPLAAPPPRRRKRWLFFLVPVVLVGLAALAAVAIPDVRRAFVSLYESVFKAEKESPKPGAEDAFAWLPEHAEAWKELCETYNGWFGRLHQEANEQRLKEWSVDPDLQKLIVRQFDRTSGIAFDPRDIVGAAGGDLIHMANNPPDKAKSREAIQKTRQAVEIIRGIKRGIDQWLDVGVKPLAEKYAQRGWTRQAELLNRRAEELKPTRGASIAEDIDKLLKPRKQLADIEERMKALAAHEEAIKLLSEDVATRARQQVLAETRATDTFESLLARLDLLEPALRSVAASARGLDRRSRAVRDLGDEALAKTFLACVKAAVRDAKDLSDLSRMMEGVVPRAQEFEALLKALRACRDEIAALHDGPLADKLWQLARAEPVAAAKLIDLNERLLAAKAPAQQIASRRKEIEEQRDALKGLGNDALAGHATILQGATSRAKSLDELLRNLDDVKTIGQAVRAEWAEIQALQKTLEGSGDKILAQFGKYVAAAVSPKDAFTSLPQKLGAVRSVAKGLADLVERDWKANRIDRELFTEQSEVHRTFDGTVADKTLEAWRKEVADYCKLDAKDPRPPVEGWTSALKDLAWRIAFLKDSPDPQKKQDGEAFDKRHKQLESDLQKMSRLAWIKKNELAVTQRAGTLGAELDALKTALRDVIEPPEEWLKRIRALAEVASSKAVNAEWAKRRDALVPAALTAQNLKADLPRYTALWRNTRTLQEFLSGLDDEKQLPRGLPDVAKAVPASAAQKAVAEEIASKREQALQAAIAAIPWGDAKAPAVALADFKRRDAWGKAVKDYVQWRDRAGELLAAAHGMGALLDAGCLLDDKPAGAHLMGAPKSLRELHAEWQKQKPPQELLPHLSPAVARIEALLALEGMGRKQLVEQATKLAKDAPVQVPVILWRRLGKAKDWPADLAELELEAALRERAAARVKPAEMAEEGPRRWEVCFNGAVARAKADELADGDVAAAIKLAPKFGVVSERLAPETQLRTELHLLRQAAAGLSDKDTKDKVNEEVEKFDKAVSALRGAAGQPAVGRLLGELRELARQKVPDDPRIGLDKAGPSGGQLAGKWKADISDDGKTVTYTWTEKGRKLTFVRIEPKDSRACYVCTTEAPVGLFIDVFRATDRWDELTGMMEAYDRSRAPEGPRTWEWRRRGQQQEIERPQFWLERESRSGQHYPDGLAPKQGPSDQHPIQYVSAPAAMDFAWLLGCRLPTGAEWQAACAAHEKGKADRKPNLRDLTWRKQQEHMRQKSQTGIRPEWPDAGIFWSNVTDRKTGGDAPLTSDQDDGILWFDEAAPLGAGRELCHLAGNVAEFVFDKPAVADEKLKALGQADASKIAGTFLKLVQDHASALGVAGASALSPPQLWDGKTRPFDKVWPVELAKGGRDSYSDVGFRLAFTAPRESPADQLRRILRKAGYLAKAPE